MTIDAALLRELADELEAAEHIRDQVHARLHELLNGTGPATEQVAEVPPVVTPAAGTSEPDRPSATAAPKVPLACRKCGREFPKGTGIRMHERWCKGTLGTVPEPTPLRARDVPKTKAFLCSRCPEAFLSREGRDAHQASHGPVPDLPGLVGRRIGGPPAAVRGGASGSESSGVRGGA